MKTIVLSHIVLDRIVDGPYRADLGASPAFRIVPRAEAAVWLHRGTEGDVARARAHAAGLGESWRVHVYDAPQADPLGRAKVDALRAFAIEEGRVPEKE